MSRRLDEIDAELDDIQARLAALEGEPPPDPPDPPPGDVLPLSDQQAVDRMRQGQQIQIVPRTDGWRVDYRTQDGEAVKSPHFPRIAQALEHHEPLPNYLKVPPAGGKLSKADQEAVVSLADLARPGRSCSVRWEKNGTHADTNWHGKKKWGDRGLIDTPTDWLLSVW